MPLQTGGDDPLLGLLEHGPLEEAGGLVLVGEQELGQLLGDGGPAAALAHEGDRPGQTDEVDAGVLVKTRVLGADQGVHEVGRQGFEAGVRPVLGVVPAQDLAVDGIDAGGEVGFGVGQCLGFWQVAHARHDHEPGQSEQWPHADHPQ